MQRSVTFLVLVVLASPAVAQVQLPVAPAPGNTLIVPAEAASPPVVLAEDGANADRLAGNHAFPGFIGYISRPQANIDPRAVTELYPIFASAWTNQAGPVPNTDFQLYGAGLTIALSERLAVGLNQGGYATVHLDTTDAQLLAVVKQLGTKVVLDLLRRNPAAVAALLRQRGLDASSVANLQRLASIDPTLKFSDVAAGGDRSGWLNLGGFVQYTLLQDPESQFLLTVGVRLEAPCGSYEIFQGHGPAEMAPYVSIGKGWGKVHVLANAGYVFPVGPGDDNLQVFYADVHLDRQTFGWLYPLVEFNFSHAIKSVDVTLPARRGFFDFGNFEATGNMLTMAVGANAVLVPEKLELGAAYLTSLATQRDFNVNGLIVKMVFRY